MIVNRTSHYIIKVQDQDGGTRKVCKCQIKDKHINEEAKVEFPVFECPELTEKYGFGTQSGI